MPDSLFLGQRALQALSSDQRMIRFSACRLGRGMFASLFLIMSSSFLVLGVIERVQAQETPGCAQGDALVAAGELDKAREAFIEALKKPDTFQCAAAGLLGLGSRSADVLCAAASVLAERGKLDKATELYTEALRRESSMENATTESCAAAGLTSLAQQPESPTSCSHARSLEDRDLRDKAETAYLAVLAADPKSTCATKGLDRLEETRSRRERTSDWITDELPEWVAFAALILLVLVLAYQLLLRLFLRLLARESSEVRAYFRRQGRIRRLLGRPIVPRISVQDFKDAAVGTQIGGGVAGVVRDLLAKPADPAEPSLDVVAGFADESFLEGLGELTPQTKGVALLLGKLVKPFPAARVTLSGNLYPGPNGSPTVGVTLTEGNSLLGSESLSAPSAPTVGQQASVEGYFDLAVATAAWVRAELAEYPARPSGGS